MRRARYKGANWPLQPVVSKKRIQTSDRVADSVRRIFDSVHRRAIEKSPAWDSDASTKGPRLQSVFRAFDGWRWTMTRTIIQRCKVAGAAILASFALAANPIAAQELEAIDPDSEYTSPAATAGAIDGDLAEAAAPRVAAAPVDSTTGNDLVAFGSDPGAQEEVSTDAAQTTDAASASAAEEAAPTFEGSETTYGKDDLIGAAEGVFGKGAEGLAGMIEDLLRKQGEPNGYIVGREGGGALVVGVRYGSGTLHHKIEGNRPVYWTGPSIGFDAGANAGNTFVLVYNLYDTEDLYERFPAGEGQAYFVGGMHASYMRKGDVVLIPIRVGAGLRLGVNAGYMKFSKKQRWLPF